LTRTQRSPGHAREGDTNDDDDLEHAGDAAADLLGRHLGNVGRADVGHDADAEAADDTAGDHRTEVGHGASRHDAAGEEDAAREDHRVLAADALHEERGGEGAKEGADVQQRDDIGAVVVLSLRVGRIVAKVLLEGDHRDDAATDAGVVWEEDVRTERRASRHSEQKTRTHIRRGRYPCRR
jgi:hypothetical protein